MARPDYCEGKGEPCLSHCDKYLSRFEFSTLLALQPNSGKGLIGRKAAAGVQHLIPHELPHFKETRPCCVRPSVWVSRSLSSL